MVKGYWTKEEDKLLEKLLKDKKTSWAEILEKLQRSDDAVDHRARRLGLSLYISAKRSRKEVNEMANKVSVNDFVNEVIRNLPKVVNPLKPIKPYKLTAGTGDEEQAVQLLSDWQLGHRTATFSSQVAKERLERLLKATVKIVNLHRNAYPIRIINLFLLGDFIQSEKVGYLVDLSELETILIEQVYKQAVPLLASYIQNISQHFEKVNVYCVRGNHGKGEKTSSERTNWDDVIYYTLQYQFQDNDRIQITIAQNFYQVVQIFNTKFLLAHGDQVRGGSYGIPLYALLQRMLRWATAMPFTWDVLCVGHWHNFAYLEQNRQFLIVNGTLVSDDEYVRKTYGWNSSTSQTLFSVHPKQGITWLYQLKLNGGKK
ncbi:MAG: Myb-like DNA-binding domain-containing protein [Candidatus Aenigmatarchaeota archaeon]